VTSFFRNYTIIGLLASVPRTSLCCSPPVPPPSLDGKIRIVVKTLTGLVISLDVDPASTVEELKEKIQVDFTGELHSFSFLSVLLYC
jgi:hypothetical protein